MEGFVLISGEAPELALAELEGALTATGGPVKVLLRYGLSAVLDGLPPEGLAERLGFSHFTGILDMTTGPGLDEIIEGVRTSIGLARPGHSISWTVRASRSGTGPSPSEIFEAVDREVRTFGRKVRHREPDLKLFIIASDRTMIGRVTEASSRSSAERRRGSKMPFNRPVIMDPRLARVLVNLSGLPPGSRVLDPFLGPAGLAIEAADLGLKVTGVEMDPRICKGARENIEHLGLSGSVEVREGDSRRFRGYSWAENAGPFDGIITDPPFGRSAATHGNETGDLLIDVLKEVFPLLKEGAPVVVDAPDPEHIRNIPGFRQKKELSLRVHKSMTRYIGVLVKE
ncbi:MAG: TRM11 family SAM-dependent methyltransferase [Thermoplasmatota archaeon]